MEKIFSAATSWLVLGTWV